MLQRLEHVRNGRQCFMDLSSFLHGSLEIEGRFSALSGLLTQRFSGIVTGTWCDGSLILDENFRYASGRSENRTWRLSFAADGTFTSTCADVIGTGCGQVDGSCYRHTYLFRLPVGRNGMVARVVETYEPVDEQRLSCSARLSKWGLPFGGIKMQLQRS